MVSYRRGYWIVAVFLTFIIGAFINYHWSEFGLSKDWQIPINFVSFIWLVVSLWMAHSNHVFTDPAPEMDVYIIMPVYNEDPRTFYRALRSFDRQTYRPAGVYVIDDGSKSRECELAFNRWKEQTSIPCMYHYQRNSGKRDAQGVGFAHTPDADIYVTVDSDTVLDERAIEEGVKPFADQRVQSVAGLLFSLNYKKNMLTRLIELGFVNSFLSGRASWSKMHSVAVNCGGLAFYRASVVRKYLDEYLTQTLFGKKLTSGDDRILTNFALLEGWTVFQESSVGYTLQPTNMKHLTNQRIRWWRSFFWGGSWLIRRFSPRRLVWWLVTWQFASFLMYTAVVLVVLITSPAIKHYLPIMFFVYLFILSYVRNVRYLSFKRPDMSFWQQLGIYLLSPVSSALHFYLCSVLQYIGLATFHVTGWGTRSKVEVGLR